MQQRQLDTLVHLVMARCSASLTLDRGRVLGESRQTEGSLVLDGVRGGVEQFKDDSDPTGLSIISSVKNSDGGRRNVPCVHPRSWPPS